MNDTDHLVVRPVIDEGMNIVGHVSNLKRLKANEVVQRYGHRIDLENTPDDELFAWLEWLDYRWDGEDWYWR